MNSEIRNWFTQGIAWINELGVGQDDYLNVGDRVEFFGSYWGEPEWLNGKLSCVGEVLAVSDLQVVVSLDAPLQHKEYSGTFIVVRHRLGGATWKNQGVVHVVLCRDLPNVEEEPNGVWVECAASYRKLTDA